MIDPDFHPRFSIVPLSASKQQICISSLKTTNNNKLQTKDLPDFTRRLSKEKPEILFALKSFNFILDLTEELAKFFSILFPKLAVWPILLRDFGIKISNGRDFFSKNKKESAYQR